jgi:hypothetical protein
MRLADLPEVKAAIAERDRLRAELEKVKVNDALRCDVRDLIESASGEPVFPPLMDAVMSVVRPLRAAVDAALALHQPEKRYHDGSAEWSTDDPSEIAEEHDYPLDEVPYFEVCAHCGEIEMSQSDHASYLESMWPCATRRALAPVADPDPHTTSDEEQS